MLNKLKTCRCCLIETETESDLYEFSSEVSVNPETAMKPQFVKIALAFKEATLIEVPENEEGTSKVCPQCLQDLKISYMFLKKCGESDRIYSNSVEEPEYMEYVEEYIDDMAYDHESTNETIEPEESADIKAEYHSDDERGEDYEYEEEVEEEPAPADIERKAKFRDILQRNKERHQSLNSPARAVMRRKAGFECHFCSKVSQSKEENLAHEEEEHAEIASYKCRQCSERFASKAHARLHFVNAHTNEVKNFACDTCSKTFKNRYQLVLHTRSHTGEKPFTCSVCKRGFSMSSNLQKHMDTHSTEKNFACIECKQFFKTQRSLKFHTICYHQPEAKVKCPQCDKSFVNKSYLKMHMLYHTGEKNYTCTLCNSKYYKSSHLKRHIQNVHLKLRLMKCEFCTSDFVRKETYRAHITSTHRRQLSDRDYEDAMERIKKFQWPTLDVNEYTLEKQTVAGFMLKTEIEEGEHEAQESIPEDAEDMVMQDGYFEQGSELYHEEEEFEDDEQ